MIGYSVISNIIAYLLKQKLVSQVYHSVDILNINNQRYPGYKKDDEWIYVGPDDSKHMQCYIREIAGLSVDKIEIMSAGGKKAYKGKVGYRMVFFNDFEKRDHDQLLIELLAFTYYPSVQLKKVINNNEELLREEGKVKDFTFGATTFYKAIDFFVIQTLQENKCELNIGCGNLQNPVTPETEL